LMGIITGAGIQVYILGVSHIWTSILFLIL
jgi:hypothetical protein